MRAIGKNPVVSFAPDVGKRWYDSFEASARHVPGKQKSAQMRKSKWKPCRALCVGNVPETNGNLPALCRGSLEHRLPAGVSHATRTDWSRRMLLAL